MWDHGLVPGAAGEVDVEEGVDAVGAGEDGEGVQAYDDGVDEDV